MRHIGGEDFEILAYAFLHTPPPQYFFDAQLAAINPKKSVEFNPAENI
jgi:hypothetical protein